MKAVLSFLFIIFSIVVNAQTHFETRLSIQMNGIYSVPVGAYRYNSSNNSYLGQTKNSFGAGVAIRKPVYKNFGLGFNINTVQTKLDKEMINKNLKKNYNSGNNYFMTTSFKTSYTLFNIGVEFFKNFQLTKTLIICPFIRINLAGTSDIGAINVTLKQRNDNYFETYKIIQTQNENELTLFFYPSIGSNFTWALNHYWGINAGAMYSFGNKKLNTTIVRNNLYSQEEETQEISHQFFSSVQPFLGLQFYFNR